MNVTINFAGPINKLNVSYRSDPPLSNADIIALLAFGRTRGQGGVYSTAQPGGNTRDTAAASNAILGQALDATFSDRVQRLFGASRVKIDPTLTGVENLPEARLTLEQQVSRDITLTYITNLNRTTEQVVRVQWDLSQQWSAVAVRNSNGLFGIDILYRRRFK